MKVRKYVAEASATPAELLEFIYAAHEAGEAAAIPAGCCPLLCASGFAPEVDGAYAGCYLFEEVRPRVRNAAISERLAALMLTLFFLPLLVPLYLLVLIVERPPVIFRQARYGVDGREFLIFKFRTMVAHGEKLHGKMQRRWGEQGRLFKLDNDPRVTRLGAVLRRLYLDELPQLANVVRGEMRICGPRPLPASDNHHYTEAYHRLRLGGMPGITGLWQVNGRNRLSFDEMCLLDRYYLCNCTLGMDSAILLRTLGVVFSRNA